MKMKEWKEDLGFLEQDYMDILSTQESDEMSPESDE